MRLGVQEITRACATPEALAHAARLIADVLLARRDRAAVRRDVEALAPALWCE